MYTAANNTLITGETGYLGLVLAHSLKVETAGSVIGLKSCFNGNRVDVREKFRLTYKQSIDSVIHVAGKAHSVPKTEEEKRAFYDVNFEGTKNLCRALEDLEQMPDSFIFISTVAVYGTDGGELISESDPLKGNTPYAESKLLAEKWLRYWTIERDITLGILRLPLVVGPNPPGNLGAMINGIKSGKYLSIGQANARKSMVWAEDIARIIPVLAEKGGTYNLTDGYHPTFGELEAGISEALGKGKPIKVPYWVAKGLALAGDAVGKRFPVNSDKLSKITSTLTFDDSKARRELGWNPTPVLSKIQEII